MSDVGQAAGVSAQTVSRYFTGRGYVSEETRTRIASAIEDLGYRPNRLARNLRTQRTNTIGVLSLGALNYGSSGVLTGLSAAARQADFTLTIVQLDVDFEGGRWRDEAMRALDHFLSVPVDGIVLSSPIPDAEQHLEAIARATPMITVSERPLASESSAGTHSFAAGHDATAHLIALGHRRILHLAGPSSRNEALERERGYRAAIEEACLEALVIHDATDWTAASGHLAGLSVNPDSFTGVFAADDELALGFLSAMEERGFRAPDDYSIVGVDDMPTAAYFSPPLTTMRLDFRNLGESTFRMLHQEITTGTRSEHFTLEPELVVRWSTSAPRRD